MGEGERAGAGDVLDGRTGFRLAGCYGMDRVSGAGQGRAIPEGPEPCCQDLVKKNLSPCSVKNLNLRSQANPGHRRAWPRPQEAGPNQVEKFRKGLW